MPWSYTIDPKRNVIFTTGTGILTQEELAFGVKMAKQDPLYHPDLNAFFDWTKVTGWKMDSDFLARLVAARTFSGGTRTAMLASNPLGYGMCRIMEAWVSNGQMMLFTDRAEAVAWLNEGVPPEKHIT